MIVSVYPSLPTGMALLLIVILIYSIIPVKRIVPEVVVVFKFSLALKTHHSASQEVNRVLANHVKMLAHQTLD